MPRVRLTSATGGWISGLNGTRRVLYRLQEIVDAEFTLVIPRVSWHSLRHSNATILGEVGESLKTAQAILGHSDLETTLNTYTHAIRESRRRATEKGAEVLCPVVPTFGEVTAKSAVN